MTTRVTDKPLCLRAGPIPLYYQLEHALRERIVIGEFGPGAALPTEDQVCEQYGVSRITVRRALDGLLQQGMIVRRRGIGSFVSEPRHGMDSKLSGSLQEFLSSATLMTTRWLALELVPPPKEVGVLYELEGGAKAHRLTVIGSLQDKPVAYLEIWFPPDIGEELSLADHDRHWPVIRIVERKFGLRVTHADQVIEASIAGAAASHLGIERTDPILRVRRSYFAGARPIEVAYVRYHPERYRYAIDFR